MTFSDYKALRNISILSCGYVNKDFIRDYNDTFEFAKIRFTNAFIDLLEPLLKIGELICDWILSVLEKINKRED